MSQFIKNGETKHVSRLIKATKDFAKQLDSYEIDPKTKGVWGSEAKIICGGVTIKSDELDVEFDVAFDDDMEANESSITVYNLSANTINNIKYHSEISIEAGFSGDTGVIFKGFVDKVTTTHDGADKVTTIRCYDDISKKTIAEITYAAGTKASYILKDLLNKTGTPIDVFNMRRDWTYKDEQKVDGDLAQNIKKYSEVCGVSTYVRNGKIYSRYIKDGDNISFTISEETGMIGSPSAYEEEITAEDYKETVKGWECECLLQHRISAGVICNLKSLDANGQYRVKSGTHTFNNGECITKVKLM